MRVKKRYALRSDKLEKYFKKMKDYLKESLLNQIKGQRWEIVETDEDFSLVLLNSNPFLIIEGETYIPHLKSKDYFNLAKVTVDQGAIPFVCNGADIMYPGIVFFDSNINSDDFVIIDEEKYNKELAIAKSAISGNDFDKNKKGKAVLNLHYVGDKKWKFKV